VKSHWRLILINYVLTYQFKMSSHFLSVCLMRTVPYHLKSVICFLIQSLWVYFNFLWLAWELELIGYRVRVPKKAATIARPNNINRVQYRLSGDVNAWLTAVKESRQRSLWSLQMTFTLTESALLICNPGLKNCRHGPWIERQPQILVLSWIPMTYQPQWPHKKFFILKATDCSNFYLHLRSRESN